jgi:hypothetical protein
MVEDDVATEWLKWGVGKDDVKKSNIFCNARALAEIIVLSNLLMACFRCCIDPLILDRFFSQ